MAAKKKLPDLSGANLEPYKRDKVRADGYYNGVTGAGTLQDKQTQGFFLFKGRGSEELRQAYYSDDISEKVVAALPKAALRRGVIFSEPLPEEVKALNIVPTVRKAAILSRLFGGSAIFVGSQDGGDLLRPLGKGKLRFLRVYDSRYCKAEDWDKDPKSPRAGLPVSYVMSPKHGGSFRAHVSRIVPFYGCEVDEDLLIANKGWGNSVLERVWETIMSFAASYAGIGVSLAEMSQGVFKIRGLYDALAADPQKLITRMQITDLQKSIYKSLLLDADGEDYQRMGVPLAGVPDLLDRLMMRVSAASDIPVSLLMGRSPAGMNATGESDMRSWYDTIEEYQRDVLKPAIESLLRLAGSSAEVSFPALWQPTDKEKAETENLRATKWATYIANGVLEPEQVTLAEFGEGEIEIDENALRASLAESGSPGLSLITPSDKAGVLTVNEVRARDGFPPWPGPEGSLTVAEFIALREAKAQVVGQAQGEEENGGKSEESSQETDPETEQG